MAKAKILGKLRGIIASAKENSRNDRKYTEQFWDDIFNSEMFLEGIKNRVFFGESWHPDADEDYGQIHPGDNAAIVLTKVEKKGLEYFGEFDILPTRAGEIVKNLYDVGCTLGISSRGYADRDMPVFNDASQYEFITFDLVAFPGIKSARLHPVAVVAEGFGKKRVNKKKVMENLNKFSAENEEDKAFIDEALKQTAEGFDDDIQVEELSGIGFDNEMQAMMDEYLVYTNNAGKPMHNHKEVIPVGDKIPQFVPNMEYLVDNLHYSNYHNCYIGTGEWIELDKHETVPTETTNLFEE